MFDKPLLIITYEDLQTNLHGEMKRLLNFLGMPIDKRRLRCVLCNSEGLHHRNSTPVKKNLFSRIQVIEIKSFVYQINRQLKSKFNLKVDDSVPQAA